VMATVGATQISGCASAFTCGMARIARSNAALSSMVGSVTYKVIVSRATPSEPTCLCTLESRFLIRRAKPPTMSANVGASIHSLETLVKRNGAQLRGRAMYTRVMVPKIGLKSALVTKCQATLIMGLTLRNFRRRALAMVHAITDTGNVLATMATMVMHAKRRNARRWMARYATYKAGA